MPDPTNLKEILSEEIETFLQDMHDGYRTYQDDSERGMVFYGAMKEAFVEAATTKISKMIEEAYSKGYSKGAADTKRVYLKMVDFAQELKKNQLQPPIPLQVNPKSHNYTTSKEETKDD